MIRRLIFAVSLLCGCCLAELQLPTVFSDHMVLQREKPVPVWGTAEPGAKVTVEFAGQKKQTVVGADGKWRVDLDPLKASDESRELVVSAGSTVRFTDVLVGEVWFCSGQSNMAFILSKTEGGAEAVAAADHPTLRLYLSPMRFSQAPAEKINAVWNRCTPETAGSFSGVAYHFARKLQEELGVPVGLIESAWGGTDIVPWTPPCGFEGIDSLKTFHEQALNVPELTGPAKSERQRPSVLYNGMIAAHIPYAIRGAIWYQGEHNHRDGMLYVDKTRALLKGWRTLWGYDFPYYLVQLAPFAYHGEDPNILPEFWEAQAEIVKTIPNTGMAVVTDAGTLNDIHPPNKKVPGARLALLALANTYEKDVISTGPLFQSLEIKPDHLEVVFSAADGLTTRDGKTPDWFEVVGEDGVFKPATAEIQGSRVLLRSDEVAAPVAMRFAWNKLAQPNLVNSAGLPAQTFRAGDAPQPKVAEAVTIPEMDGFKVIYQLELPANCRYMNSMPDYSIDNSADSPSFSRIAYMLELQKPGEPVQYAFAAMDAFTDDLKKIGIPVAKTGARFMQQVSGLTVRSNVEGVVPCTNSECGNIEFWPGNYGPINSEKIPGASSKNHDFGDMPNEQKIPGYGCMQVHNWQAKQTVFALNHWNADVEGGIGNAPNGKPDWTFSKNGGDYILRRLTVMVK